MTTASNCFYAACWMMNFLAIQDVPPELNLAACTSDFSTGAIIKRHSWGYSIAYAPNYIVRVPWQRVIKSKSRYPEELQVCPHKKLMRTHTKWIILPQTKKERP